ncbi:MAG: helix-turn-helix transcriptional regulator [Rhodobacteraceae bacterium]|nr:helix-turn-helix transcriptional regulator [Paracoccaceae bacterium]
MTKTFGQAFGELILRKRGESGLTQKELAIAAFDDETKVRRIIELELGQVARPQIKTIDPLVAYFGITPEELATCRANPSFTPQETEAIGLTRELLENLAQRFEHTNPDAPEAELIAHLKDKAKDWKALKEKLADLETTKASLANQTAAAEAAIERGDFDEADAILEAAEDLHADTELRAASEVQSKLRFTRGEAALLKGDPDKAFDRFEAAAACFDPFDLERAAAVRDHGLQKLYTEGLKYSGSYLSHAIALGEKAVARATEAKSSAACAGYQNNLGLALQNLGIRSEGDAGKTLLARSVTAHESALAVYTKDAMPLEWAMTQNNLGNALANQGVRSESDLGNALLARSVTAFQAALQVHTKDAMPVDWAMTQNNLGNTLKEQGIRSENEASKTLLARSATAFEASLIVYTKDAMPLDWAMAHYNLGNSLGEQGYRTDGAKGLTLLTRAVKTLEMLFAIVTKDAIPVRWATLQSNIGATLIQRANHPATDDPKPDLTLALAHLDQALTVFDPKHMPYNYQKCKTTRDQVAAALAALGE